MIESGREQMHQLNQITYVVAAARALSHALKGNMPEMAAELDTLSDTDLHRVLKAVSAMRTITLDIEDKRGHTSRGKS